MANLAAYAWDNPSMGTTTYTSLPVESPYYEFAAHQLLMAPVTVFYNRLHTTSTPSPSSSAAPRHTSSLPTSTTTSQAVPRSSDSKVLRIGIAVGVGIGGLMLLSAILLFLRRRRHTQNGDVTAESQELHDEPMGIHHFLREILGQPKYEMEDTSSPMELGTSNAEKAGLSEILHEETGIAELVGEEAVIVSKEGDDDRAGNMTELREESLCKDTQENADMTGNTKEEKATGCEDGQIEAANDESRVDSNSKGIPVVSESEGNVIV
jgi:hypothetical protein